MGFLSLPRIDPEWVRAETDPRLFWRRHVPVTLATGAAFYLPVVRGLTGVNPVPVTLGITAHLLDYALEVFAGAAERHPRAFGVLACSTNAVASALPAATTGRPWTPLWLLYFMYVVVAANAFGWNALVLAILTATPFLVAFLPWGAVGLLPLREGMGDALALTASVASAYALLTIALGSQASRRRERREAERAEAAEAERRRVAHDLHATLGAALSEVAVWQDVAAGSSGPGASEALSRAQARAREALAELRTTVQGLAGGEVAPEAIEGRLRRRLASLCEASGVTLTLSVKGEAPVVAIRAYHLQKFVEEAVVNAVRHAGSREVSVVVGLEPLGAAVRDDGAGFDPSAAPRGHGLTALAAHAEALGAGVAIDSAPGRGTEVRLAAGAPAGGTA